MLELSRLQAKDRATLLKNSFDISEQLRLTLITFADKIDQKHLEVVFNVPEEAIKVLGDVDAITQVIYNLLDNAIKFSRENSPLTISLWKDSKKAPDAARVMKITAADLYERGLIEQVIPEQEPATIETMPVLAEYIRQSMTAFFERYGGKTKEEIRESRYQRFRNM